MNVKVFFVENEDFILDGELGILALVKDIMQTTGFSTKLTEII